MWLAEKHPFAQGLDIHWRRGFFGCWELRSVSCPAGLVAIGDGAFEECFSLNKVKFNKGLKAIGAGAFLACESLEEIVLPAGLEFIGDDAFYGASLKRFCPEKCQRPSD